MIGGGLNLHEKDERDFNLGAILGLPKLDEIPDEFSIGDIEVKDDQKETDLCTSFTVTRVSAAQEDVELSPEYQFAKTKQIKGFKSYEAWGATNRDACKSAVRFGSLPKHLSPYSLEKNSRDEVANWHNWELKYDTIALPYKKASFFSVEGPYDIFDNIRAALWQSFLAFEMTGDKSQLHQVVSGSTWHDDWTYAEDALLFSSKKSGVGHAYRITGVKKFKEKLFLIASLSNGTNIGDRGKFYVPREVSNNDFTFGIYTFRDITRQQAEALKNTKAVQRSWLREWIYEHFGI